MKALLVAGAMLVSLVPIANANETSPIFGTAKVAVTTADENKAVIGKGVDADLYGYYGTYYSGLATQYGSLGFYYANATYYQYAYQYAYDSYYYYYYANYYQKNGM